MHGFSGRRRRQLGAGPQNARQRPPVWEQPVAGAHHGEVPKSSGGFLAPGKLPDHGVPGSFVPLRHEPEHPLRGPHPATAVAAATAVRHEQAVRHREMGIHARFQGQRVKLLSTGGGLAGAGKDDHQRALRELRLRPQKLPEQPQSILSEPPPKELRHHGVPGRRTPATHLPEDLGGGADAPVPAEQPDQRRPGERPAVEEPRLQDQGVELLRVAEAHRRRRQDPADGELRRP